MPLPESSAQAIGTAVHAGMEFVVTVQKATGAFPSVLEIERVITKSLSRSQLPFSVVKASEKHAHSVISAYLEEVKTLPLALMVERSFGKQHPVMLEGIKLVGKIDRIEEVRENVVRVIDYKTSKPVSRNHVLGNTQGSDGRYWRQLLFYALLAQQDPDFHQAVQEGVLVFLEPNDTGKFKTEVFIFEEQQLRDFAKSVVSLWQEMQELSFLEKPACEECDVCHHLGFSAKK